MAYDKLDLPFHLNVQRGTVGPQFQTITFSNGELQNLLRVNDICRTVRQSQEATHQQKYPPNNNITCFEFCIFGNWRDLSHGLCDNIINNFHSWGT
jgi:hypothetical protein